MPIRHNSSLELQEFQEAASEPAELDVADEEQPSGSGDDNRWYMQPKLKRSCEDRVFGTSPKVLIFIVLEQVGGSN
jgi:hypothetical protein